LRSVATPLIRYEVLGTPIAGIGLDQAMTIVEQWVARGQPGYLCHANVHGIMEARRDHGLRQAYAAAGLVVADGVPLVWVGRLLGQRAVRRVYGPDFMLLLAERAAARGYRVFFYGGASGVAADLAAQFRRRFPGLRVVGAESPPFRSLTAEEDAATTARINASGADIVWVGLGCPKQERWMAEHRAALTAPVLIGVGAAFDFHAGRVPQAPRWLMPFGLEWLYRLIQEPRRLWRRYLLYNPLFVLLVAGQLLRGARRRVSGSP
jgi:N-acetylglucosaminyldiphosphoundecaprenol N-acetyl-beta-D-mannosaminyltransferase